MKAQYDKKYNLWVITHGRLFGREEFVGKTYDEAMDFLRVDVWAEQNARNVRL